MKINIRLATPDDWKTIQNLNNYVFLNDQDHDPDLDLNWPFSQEGINYYQKLASGKNSSCLIAEADSEAIGYVAISIKNFGYRKSKYVEIENIGVLPKYRSHGIGKMLITEVKKWADKKNINKLYVSAYSKNCRAIEFYQSCGFKPIGIELEMDFGGN